MPVVGVKIDNQEMSFKDALKYSYKNSHLARSYFHYLYQESLTPHGFPSVTVLGNCPRANWIMKNKDLYINVNSQYPMFQGTMIHSMLENLNLNDNYMKEYHMNIQIGKHTIGGTCDLYNKKTKQLIDYKTIKQIRFKEVGDKLVPQYLYKKAYIRQLHTYALGLEQNGYEVKSLAIEYFPKESSLVFYTDERGIERKRTIRPFPYRIIIKYDKDFQEKLIKKYSKVLDELMSDSKCPSWEKCYKKGEHKNFCYELDDNNNIIKEYCTAAYECKKMHDNDVFEMQVLG